MRYFWGMCDFRQLDDIRLRKTILKTWAFLINPMLELFIIIYFLSYIYWWCNCFKTGNQDKSTCHALVSNSLWQISYWHLFHHILIGLAIWVKINRENTNLWSKKKEKRALIKENRKSQSTHGIRENNQKKLNKIWLYLRALTFLYYIKAQV